MSTKDGESHGNYLITGTEPINFLKKIRKWMKIRGQNGQGFAILQGGRAEREQKEGNFWFE